MLFKHCSLIQEGDAILFYRYDRTLKGYVIPGLIVAPTLSAGKAFLRLWKYFLGEIVGADDIYCSLVHESSMIAKFVTYHSEIEGRKIYKVDNSFKDQYSAYTKHLEG